MLADVFDQFVQLRSWELGARVCRAMGQAAPLAPLDLLEDVVRQKSRFFASAWTHYETARPGHSGSLRRPHAMLHW